MPHGIISHYLLIGSAEAIHLRSIKPKIILYETNKPFYNTMPCIDNHDSIDIYCMRTKLIS